MKQTKVLLLILLLTHFSTAEYSTADSLLEEAIFQYQILGDLENASKIFNKIKAEFPDNPYEQEVSARGLELCRKLQGISPNSSDHSIILNLSGKQSMPLLLWRKISGYGNISDCIVAGDYLALTTGNGLLIVVQIDNGKVLWVRKGINSYVTPAYMNGNIYASTKSGKIISISLVTGKTKWSSVFRGVVTSGIVCSKSGELFAASGKTLFALNIRTGREKWKKKVKVNNWVSKPPVVWSGRVLFTLPENGIVVLNSKTGKNIWKSTLSPSINVLKSKKSLFVVSGSSLHTLNKRDGKSVWNFSAGNNITFAGFSSNGCLYILDNSGEISGIDIKDGVIKSTFKARPGICKINDKKILLLGKKGLLSLYKVTGEKIWDYASGETGKSGVVIAKGNPVIYTEKSGLFLLNGNYSQIKDRSLVRSRKEIRSLVEKGMYSIAEKQISYMLKNIYPGDVELNIQNAILFQKNGKKNEAFRAWERCLELVSSLEFEKEELSNYIKDLSGASWVKYMESAGKFSPFYITNRGIVMLGEGEVNLYSINTGQRMWKYRVEQSEMVIQTATISNSMLYCFGAKRLFCLDIERQKEVWKKKFNANVTSLSIGSHNVAVGTWNRGCYLINPSNGRRNNRLLSNVKALFPYSYKDKMFYVGLGGDVAGYYNNKQIFKRDIFSKIGSIPFIKDDKIIVSTSDGFIKSFSVDNGREIWRTAVKSQTSSFTADESNLYVLFSNSFYGAFSLKTGEPVWLKKGGAGVSESIACNLQKLAIPIGKGVMICDTKFGNKLDVLYTAGQVSSIIFENGMLFVRLENGLIYRFDV